jgi:hypothetical protein
MPWKSVTSWTSVSGLSSACSRARRWRHSAPSSGFSRKTGYRIYDRYKDSGVVAFSDRSRRPHRQANRLSAPIEATIVRLNREYPGWGAEDPEETAAAVHGTAPAGHQHRARGA